MSLTSADSIARLLGRSDTYSTEQKVEAASAATNYIKKVCNRQFEQATYRHWLPWRGSVPRSLTVLPEYPLISILSAFASVMNAGTILDDGTGLATTTSIVDGKLYVGTETFTLSAYSTMALLKTAVDAGSYSLTIKNEGDPQDLRHGATAGLLELPSEIINLFVIDAPAARIKGRYMFVKYSAGFATIPDDLEHIATRLAISHLQDGMPPGAGNGSQLDANVLGFDIALELQPYIRMEFGAWSEEHTMQVTEWGQAGWETA